MRAFNTAMAIKQKNKDDYGESSIRVLKGLEPVKQRPGMYTLTDNPLHIIQEVIDKQLAVVDLTASIMCMENHMPMYVFGLNEENSIVKAISGKFNGTVVTV